MTDCKLLTVVDGSGGLEIRRKDLADVMADTGTPVYGTVEGDAVASHDNSVVVHDAAGLRFFRSINVRIDPVQAGSGGPAEDNIRPISGAESVKICRYGTELFSASGSGPEKGKILQADGTVTTIVSPTPFEYSANQVSDYIPVSGIASVIVRYLGRSASTSSVIRIVGYDSDKVSSGQLFEVTNTVKGESLSTVALNGAAYIRIYKADYSFRSFGVFDASEQFEVTVTFPDDPGTVYGGWVDVSTGAMIIDTAFKAFDGTEEWGSANTTNQYFFYRLGAKGDVIDGSGVCSHFEPVIITSSDTNVGQYVVNSTARNQAMVAMRPSAYSGMSPAAFKAWLAAQAQNGTPVQLAWKLTTPLKYSMTPVGVASLTGDNYIGANIGSLSIVYARQAESVRAEQAEKLDAVNGMIAEDAPGGIAQRAYTEGEFLTWDGKLYKTLGDIAYHEDLTSVPELLEETTVGEQLAAIWAALNA